MFLKICRIEILQEFTKDALLIDDFDHFTVILDISGVTYYLVISRNQIEKCDLKMLLFFCISSNFLKVIATLHITLEEKENVFFITVRAKVKYLFQLGTLTIFYRPFHRVRYDEKSSAFELIIVGV